MPNNPFSSLFGQSPIKPIQTHMDKVHQCAEKLFPFIKASINNDWERLEKEANLAFSIQMGGAVGNLSAFGKNANNLRELCAKKLKLKNSGNS